MKILFTNDNLIGGGVEKLMNDLLPLINREHRCDLLILTWKDEKYRESLKKAGVKVTAVPERVKGHAAKIKYIKRFIEHGGYDVVHANEFPMFYYCSIAGRMMKHRPLMVMTEHDTSNRRRNYRLFRHLERWIYNGYDRIISISPETEEAVKKWLSPFRSSKFVTIYNGIPTEEFRRAIPCKRNDLSSIIKDQDILLCMVGRLSYKKNHSYMFDVMEHLPCSYKLVLCGDGELRSELEREVEERGLVGRVIFLGFRSDAASVMKASDIVVIPSKWEGFGLVAVEAMVCGKPVVCTDIQGLSAVVGDGGIKASADDCIQFAEAILKLRDEELRNKVVKNAIARCELFDIGRMKHAYINLYQTALKGV